MVWEHVVWMCRQEINRLEIYGCVLYTCIYTPWIRYRSHCHRNGRFFVTLSGKIFQRKHFNYYSVSEAILYNVICCRLAETVNIQFLDVTILLVLANELTSCLVNQLQIVSETAAQHMLCQSSALLDMLNRPHKGLYVVIKKHSLNHSFDRCRWDIFVIISGNICLL